MYKNKDIAIARELELAEVLLDFIVVAAKFAQKVNPQKKPTANCLKGGDYKNV